MFRTVLESVLGLQIVNGDTLMIRPCVPHGWDRCAITYRLPGGGAVYEIVIRNPGARADGVVAVKVDGRVAPIQRGTVCVRLARDGALHRVEVVLG
jgi:cyclic beta-1,2-glucan synthetase